MIKETQTFRWFYSPIKNGYFWVKGGRRNHTTLCDVMAKFTPKHDIGGK
jgi:hypothetical protein